MKKRSLIPLVLLFLSCHSSHGVAPAAKQKIPWRIGLPVYDHVVIVMEENKDYEQILGNRAAPYINALKADGASFTKMYAEEHHSQGNYFWLFSGHDQNVGFYDIVPRRAITASNLGEQLLRAGRSFKGYCEDLPAIGSTVTKAGAYARKHAPWISFSNLPNGTTAATSVNLRWQDFSQDYAALPTVSFVIPNQDHDMHNGELTRSIAAGDAWLRQNLDGYRQWAKQHNSLLIVTFDENDHGDIGLTDPADPDWRERNRIVAIFTGARIKPGEYDEKKGITHVNILRTLEAMYGLVPSGAQQPNALRAGIADDFTITDIYSLLP